MHSTYIHIIYSFNFLISLIVSSKPRNAPYNYAIKNKDTSIYMNVSQVCHMDVTSMWHQHFTNVSHGCHMPQERDTSIYMNVSQVCHMDVTCHMGVSHGCHINVNVFDTSVFQGWHNCLHKDATIVSEGYTSTSWTPQAHKYCIQSVRDNEGWVQHMLQSRTGLLPFVINSQRLLERLWT